MQKQHYPASSGQTPAEDPRWCDHRYEDGRRCHGWRSTTTGLCPGHARIGLAADPVAAGKVGAEVTNTQAADRAETRRKAAELARMTPKQRLESLAAEQQDAVDTAFRDAIRTGSLEDLRRAQASELLLSRVYGRPTERTEVKTDLPPVLAELERFTPEERRALLAGLASGKRLQVVDNPPEPEAKAS